MTRQIVDSALDATLVAADERLGQAQKLEALGALTASVAHDVNNALTIIMTYVVLVMDQLKPDDPMRSDLEEAREAASRATQLIRQLPRLGRLA